MRQLILVSVERDTCGGEGYVLIETGELRIQEPGHELVSTFEKEPSFYFEILF